MEDLIRRAAITAVLNLQTDEDLRHWQIDWASIHDRYLFRSILVRQVPVRDFDTVDLRHKLAECVRVLQELLDARHRVYIHCTAGVGRSPTVVIAYLVWCRSMRMEHAVALVKRRHHCVPDLEAIQGAKADTSRSNGAQG